MKKMEMMVETMSISLEQQPIVDLRTALAALRTIPGQLIETDEPVEPFGELSGVYRYIGAGGTVAPPTQIGPAMVFNQVKGHPGSKVAIGLLACRNRVAFLLGTPADRLGFMLGQAVARPVAPVTVSREQASCYEVIYRAEDPDFDIRKLLPAPTNTVNDAGPYITMGMCYASDPENGDSDITIHRLCLQGRDEMTMFFTPGARHLDVFRKKAEKEGKPLPISISIGVDPAIQVAACFEPPTTPLGYDELGVAGAIRNRPVELVDCLTIREKAIAHAEYVIEGELLPGVRVAEDRYTGTGQAMPEFTGYTGKACESIPVIKVKLVAHRQSPIMQTTIGPSEEHVNLVGIPMEASIIQAVERAMPGRLINVYAHSSGGGKYMAIIQFRKAMPSDEGRQRQAALVAFSAFPELKHIILVDEDVDPFNSNEVLWALNTRYQGDIDTVFIPGVRCHPLDPTQNNAYNPMLTDTGMTCKVIFDCTVPYHLKDRFKRSEFLELDPRRFVPDYRADL